jgi:hypothetical protein
MVDGGWVQRWKEKMGSRGDRIVGHFGSQFANRYLGAWKR